MENYKDYIFCNINLYNDISFVSGISTKKRTVCRY